MINFVAKLTSFVNKFDGQESRKQKDVDFIRTKFGYPEGDIRDWLRAVRYPKDCTKLDGTMLVKTLLTLNKTGAIIGSESDFDPLLFTNNEVVRIE